MRLSDATALREAEDARLFASWDKRNAERNRLAAIDKANAEFILGHPGIGMLMRNGRPVYYVVRDGETVESADPKELV